MANWYYSTGGSDGAAGSIVAPFRNPAKAASMAVAGDFVIGRAGTYTGSGACVDSQTATVNSGTNFLSGAITYQIFPGDSPVIWQPPDNVAPVRIATNPKQYLIFQDLIFDGINTSLAGDADGIYLGPGANHCRFQRCTVKNHSNSGFHVTELSSFHEFLQCIVQDGRLNNTPPAPHAFYITGSDNLFLQCVVVNSKGYGFHIYNNHGSHDDPSRNVVKKCIVRGHGANGTAAYGIVFGWGDANEAWDNLIYAPGGAAAGGIQVYTDSTNAKVYNNTVVGMTTEGVATQFYGTGCDIRGNILRSNAGGDLVDYGTGSGASITTTPNFTADPSFVSLATPDYHLNAGSAALNVAPTIALVTDDFDGNLRPQGAAYDYGAYERAVAAPPSGPTLAQHIGTDGNSALPAVGIANGWATPVAGQVLVAMLHGRNPAGGATMAGWTPVYNRIYQGSHFEAAWIKVSTGTESAPTVTLGASDFWAIDVSAWSGIHTGTPLRAQANQETNSATPIAGPTDATPQAGDIAIGAFSLLFNTATAGAGWSAFIPTNQAQMYWGTNFGAKLAMVRQTVAANGAVTASWTLSDSHGAASAVVVLRAGAVIPPVIDTGTGWLTGEQDPGVGLGQLLVQYQQLASPLFVTPDVPVPPFIGFPIRQPERRLPQKWSPSRLGWIAAPFRVQDVTAAAPPLSWEPQFPDRLSRKPQAAVGHVAMSLSAAIPFQDPSRFGWRPRYPSFVLRKRLPVAAHQSFANSWQPMFPIPGEMPWDGTYPDQVFRRKRLVDYVWPAFNPFPLPNAASPDLAWQGYQPSRVPRAARVIAPPALAQAPLMIPFVQPQVPGEAVYPDTIARRRLLVAAMRTGSERFDIVVPDIRTDWQPTYPDQFYRVRRTPTGPTQVAAVSDRAVSPLDWYQNEGDLGRRPRPWITPGYPTVVLPAPGSGIVVAEGMSWDYLRLPAPAPIVWLPPVSWWGVFPPDIIGGGVTCVEFSDHQYETPRHLAMVCQHPAMIDDACGTPTCIDGDLC